MNFLPQNILITINSTRAKIKWPNSFCVTAIHTHWNGTGTRTFFEFNFLKINSVESGHHVSHRVNETTKPETAQGSKG